MYAAEQPSRAGDNLVGSSVPQANRGNARAEIEAQCGLNQDNTLVEFGFLRR